MRKVCLNALAEGDLLDIWAYSFEQWDVAHADKYLDELRPRYTRLRKTPSWA